MVSLNEVSILWKKNMLVVYSGVPYLLCINLPACKHSPCVRATADAAYPGWHFVGAPETSSLFALAASLRRDGALRLLESPDFSLPRL